MIILLSKGILLFLTHTQVSQNILLGISKCTMERSGCQILCKDVSGLILLMKMIIKREKKKKEKLILKYSDGKDLLFYFSVFIVVFLQ